MVRFVLAITVALSLVSSAISADNIPQYLQSISVTVKSDMTQGSGTIVTREIPGKGTVAFVWTAGHVVSNLRSTRRVVDTEGGTRYLVEFQDPQIVAERYQEGRRVGEQTLDCKVVKYSDYRYGEDLAVLMIRLRNSYSNDLDARFPKAGYIPPAGTELSHCGSLLGKFGSSSYTTGVLSQTGRLLDGKVFDQVTAVAFPGSSGGGVYVADSGVYIGMLTRGVRMQGFNFVVPVRRMHTWAREANVEWAINLDVPMPSWDVLMDIPVEDEGIISSGSSGFSDDYENIFNIIDLPFVEKFLP